MTTKVGVEFTASTEHVDVDAADLVKHVRRHINQATCKHCSGNVREAFACVLLNRYLPDFYDADVDWGNDVDNLIETFDIVEGAPGKTAQTLEEEMAALDDTSVTFHLDVAKLMHDHGLVVTSETVVRTVEAEKDRRWREQRCVS